MGRLFYPMRPQSDDGDLGPFGADPLPHVGGRKVIRMMDRDALAGLQTGLEMQVGGGPEVMMAVSRGIKA